ncbi:beta-L-arabinofuranosidase domain-containing protein [Arcticibacter sp. MXS-1]|uniref:beta-L-arabinofuranosidase domain-containing protein n=1 Tax=Arcticibacter sp. MXS-1 TaxID=3341726 RepID=UPI0035A8C7B0
MFKLLILPAFVLLPFWGSFAQGIRAEVVARPATEGKNLYYTSNRSPLLQAAFLKLPVTSFSPSGWLLKALNLQKEGLTGNLGEISVWLSKKNNAWLNREGKGEYGWEELPYWLKGYGDIAYMLNDQKMISETKFWIEAVLSNQRPNGDFGPSVEKGKGKRDLWTNMPMLWCLQSYYEYSKDQRVLDFMTRYFKWQLTIPDELFLEDYWENSRGGDNLYSIFWLYNITGGDWLLDLAQKTDRNTANWRQAASLPNWHNVNIAQCFREPAQYYLLSQKEEDLNASYNNFKLVRSVYGQVPGGMFGADENARKGYDDPRQATETCGFVEQMTSDQMLLRYTGDTFWADNCEDIAYNSFPAAFMPDYRSLRYLTAPNMAISDSKNHHPGIDNSGPFLMMNPFSSRCCQHNHSAGWVYFAQNTWMATQDNGLAAQFYTEGSVKAKVGSGQQVEVWAEGRYPFDENISLKLKMDRPGSFPLYLRIPSWSEAARIKVNGQALQVQPVAGRYIRITRIWKDGDRISLHLPMKLKVRQWAENKSSVSVNYGPLTYSLKIKENYIKKDSKETAIGDSRWQENADPGKWPSFEIHPGSAWNYGLSLDEKHPEKSFQIVRKKWPADDNPFTNASAPVELRVRGKKISAWGIDSSGLVSPLPRSPLTSGEREEILFLVPMGGARLRISAFPVVK